MRGSLRRVRVIRVVVLVVWLTLVLSFTSYGAHILFLRIVVVLYVVHERTHLAYFWVYASVFTTHVFSNDPFRIFFPEESVFLSFVMCKKCTHT